MERRAERPILLIEDDAAVQEMLLALLGDAGYRVVSAAHGEEAWQLLPRLQPALIITDLQMPVLDGLALYRRLQAHTVYRTIPIIFMTGFPVVAAHELLGQVLLQKPFAVEVFLDVVEQLLPPSDG